MRILFFISLTSLLSCQTKDENHPSIIDYIKYPDSEHIREFQSKTDSSILKVFVQQDIIKLNDSILELNYIWKRSDSLLINNSHEKYYVNNSIEFISQSFYEIDSLNIPLEVKGAFLSEKKFSLDQSNPSIEVQYKFQTDSSLTMNLLTKFEYKFQKIDTLNLINTNCLIISTKDKITLNYTDERNDTTMLSSSIRVYGKEKGLILFKQETKDSKVTYRIKE
jgi:hypothetical protein